MAWSPSDTVFPDTLPEDIDWFEKYDLPTTTDLGIGEAPAASGGFGAEAALGVGMFASLLGSLMQGNAAMAQANAEKAAADYNARVARMEGDAEYRRRSRIARQELSRQWVQMAGKSGVIDESGLHRMARNAEEMERHALNAAISGRNTARLERMRGRAAVEIGEQRRTAAIIGGVANVAAQGLSYSIS